VGLGAPCDGYIVQHVNFACIINGQSDGGEYWEAWKVREGWSKARIFDEVRDHALIRIGLTDGWYKQVGEIRFYCDRTTKDLAKMGWEPNQTYRGKFGICPTSAGELISTGDIPEFWELEQRDGIGWRVFEADWLCTPPKVNEPLNIDVAAWPVRETVFTTQGPLPPGTILDPTR
jgi:hypothetical protein